MKRKPAKLAPRLGIYLVGLVVLAFGITLAVNSNLGVSPVTSLPYVVSQVLHVTLGTCTVIVYSCYIFLQMLLKGGKFQPVLLQLVFSTVFGYLVDAAKLLLADFLPNTYFGQLAMLAASIVLLSFSLVLYIDVKIASMPPEGLVTCIADKLGKPFPKIKTLFDCVSVLGGLTLCFLFLGKVGGSREGTIGTALLVGKLTGGFRKQRTPLINRVGFED